MRIPAAAFLLAAVLTASACGSSTKGASDASNTSCRLILTLSGEVSLAFGEGSASCMTVNGTPSELLALFQPKSNAVVSGLGIAVTQFTAGQVGTGYPATLNIDLADGRTFYALACTVDIDENTAVGTTTTGTKYRISGQGQCSIPATASGASIDVSPFQFTTTALR
jgi:hypothetical protein